MSMMGYLAALSSAQIAAFVGQPSLASDFADLSAADAVEAGLQTKLSTAPPAVRQQYEEARREMLRQAPEMARQLARLEAVRRQLAALGPFAPVLQLDKTWHALHYLFTGHADASAAPGDSLLSGEPMGEDVSYGSPRMLDSAAVRFFADFLAPLEGERLAERLDLVRMGGLRIYPIGDDLGPGEAEAWRQSVLIVFARLKPYVAAAAERGDGLLVWLS